MSRLNCKRRGFAMLMALAILGTVAVTLLVLSRHFADDVLRTRNVTREAQLSQLLLAGAEDAMQRSRNWSGPPQKQQWEIELPRELSSSSTKLSVDLTPMDDRKADLIIEAQMGRQAAVQTIHFQLADDTWAVKSVELLGAK
jgi:hypothetical protein